MTIKTKALTKIEAKLATLEEGSPRYTALDACRRFKTSWMELGQALAGVHHGRMHSGWGYSSFEDYCQRELGIRHATAQKLLRSYAFLEAEEPDYLKRLREAPKTDSRVPELDSVNLLRLAKKSKRIDESDYSRIRRDVLEESRAPKDVQREVRLLTGSEPPKDPRTARAERREKFLKQLIRMLESAKLEAIAGKFLPAKLIDQFDDLSEKVEKELEQG